MAERIIPDRFLDAGQEPEQTLTPIRGYEKAPLVSLKEAIQPIKSLLYDVDSMVETARRNSRKPANGLTPDESAAIHLYTMQWPNPHRSLFTLLNENLRSQDRNTLTSWFLFLKLFFTALYKLPSFKGTIWRGVQGNLSDQYDEDQIWWGASSCTETMEIMQTFVGVDSVRTIFTIECINGKAIQSHSYFRGENEILLVPGSYFQVVSKWKPAKDLYMIHLREKIPPYQTIAPPFDLPSPLIKTPSLEKLTISTENKDISIGNTASAQSHALTSLELTNTSINDAEDASTNNQAMPTSNNDFISNLLKRVQAITGQHQKDPVKPTTETRECPTCNRKIVCNDELVFLQHTTKCFNNDIRIQNITTQLQEDPVTPAVPLTPITVSVSRRNKTEYTTKQKKKPAPIDIPLPPPPPTVPTYESKKCPVCSHEFFSTSDDVEMYDHIEKCLFPTGIATEPKEYECPNCNRKMAGNDEAAYLQHLSDCFSNNI